jgi:(p)ppGpp synthase/HD superfamily hydrolase
MSQFAKALRFMYRQHGDQTDRSGQPFIGHPLRVATYAASNPDVPEEGVIAALLHDVVEDTGATAGDVRAEFGTNVAHFVDALTRRDDETYKDYVRRVAQSGPVPIMLKLADIRDNTDDRRVPPELRTWAGGMKRDRYDWSERYLREQLDSWRLQGRPRSDA